MVKNNRMLMSVDTDISTVFVIIIHVKMYV